MIATRQDGRWQRAVPVVAWQQCRACLHNDLHFDPAGAGCGTHQGSRASCIRRRRAPPTAHAPSRPPPAPQPRRTRLPAPARSVGFAPWPLDNVLKLRLTRGTQEFRSKTHTSGGRCPSRRRPGRIYLGQHVSEHDVAPVTPICRSADGERQSLYFAHAMCTDRDLVAGVARARLPYAANMVSGVDAAWVCAWRGAGSRGGSGGASWHTL